jgi:LuxR family maltose regulon positive regulatory protein
MTRADGSGDASGRGRFAAPQPAAGLALRSAVLVRLSGPDVRVGVITAPAGYGKTSHAAVWVGLDGRPAAWIDIEVGHNDAVVLLADLVAALTTVTDFGGEGLGASGAGPDQYATGVAVALGRALRRCTVPFVLVLDDVHVLSDLSAVDLIGALVSSVPNGSMLLLVGRALRSEELTRERVGSSVVEIGVGCGCRRGCGEASGRRHRGLACRCPTGRSRLARRRAAPRSGPERS